MKKALVVLLAACMLGASVGCGSQSPSGSGAQPSTTTSASSESVTDKIDFHGVHLQLPAPAEVINDEENDSAYSVGEDIQVNVNLADTTELDVVANGREYAPEIALFYYSDAFEGGDTESRETDHVMIDGTFALVERFPGDSDNATVILILDSEVVRIELYGNSDAIQQVIDAIEIDGECIPECAARLTPEALKEAGLREQAWLAEDIVYLNVPEGYKLIDLGDGTQIWGGPDGRSYFSVQVDDASLVYATEDIVESTMSAKPNFVEFGGYSSGMKGCSLITAFMFIARDSSGEPYYCYTYCVLPHEMSDQSVNVMGFLYSEEEVELFENMMDTVRFADGWVVNGLVDDEPVPVDEA
jgi:hypothetical protein